MSLFPEEKHFLIGKKSERLRDTLGNSSVYARVDLSSIILRLVAPALSLSLPLSSLVFLSSYGEEMEEETDKIKGITEDKNRGVDKHPLFYAARLSVPLSLSLLLPDPFHC